MLPPGFGGGVGCGVNYAVSVPGFPPLADYQVSPNAAGTTVLSRGPQTVYYTRTVAAASFRPGLRSTRQRLVERDRVRYVNALVPKHFEMRPLSATTPVTMRWTDAWTFREDVFRHCRALEDQYQQVVSLLVLRKDLTEHERRTLHPIIKIDVEDYRRDQSTPLPPIELPAAAGTRALATICA
jgi:hypothetical protein